MPLTQATGALLAFALFSYASAQDCSTTCQSYGIDFIDQGGPYFQNVLSTDPFTAWEEFTGCQNDTAHNILVDPSGDQYECNQTPMTNDQIETVTCPIDKNKLVSGNWSMIILSNNGDCAPIDYMRQFSLSVGPQVTRTAYGGVATILSTSTSVVSTTITSTSVVTSTASPSTTTVPGAASTTVTVVPPPRVTVITKGVYTSYKTSISAVFSTATITPPCNHVPRAEANPTAVSNTIPVPDAINSVYKITVGSFSQPALAPTKAARAVSGARRVRSIVQVRSVEARHPDSVPIVRRHPDLPTTIVTAALSTITQTVLASTVLHVTGTTTLLRTTTITPAPVTVSGKGAQVATVTAPGQVITNFFCELSDTRESTHMLT